MLNGSTQIYSLSLEKNHPKGTPEKGTNQTLFYCLVFLCSHMMHAKKHVIVQNSLQNNCWRVFFTLLSAGNSSILHENNQVIPTSHSYHEHHSQVSQCYVSQLCQEPYKVCTCRLNLIAVSNLQHNFIPYWNEI